MKQAFTYSIKVWLTAVVLGPVLDVLVEFILHPRYFDGVKAELGFIGYSIPYGLILSIPSLFFLLTTLVIFEYTSAVVLTKRIVLSIVAILLTYTPFYLLFYSADDIRWFDTFLWASSYCMIIVGAIWFYNLKPVAMQGTNVSL
jgi:hypothetical protein